MKKTAGLSKNQEKLLSILEYKKLIFITRNELITIINKYIDVKNANKLILSMIKKNRLKSIIKAKYLVIPMRAINKKWTLSESEIIKFLMGDSQYYFGLGTAFNQHHFTEQIPNKLFIFNSKYSYNKHILNYYIKMIKIKKSRLFGFSNSDYPSSDKERTIIDALKYSSYLGGLDSVLDILKNIKFNQKKLEKYAIRYNSIKIIKLIGMITDSSKLYKYLKKNKKLYYTSIKGIEKKNKKWKIIPN